MTAVSVREGSVASAAGLSPRLVAGDRALRALHAAETLARSRRTLAERGVPHGSTSHVWEPGVSKPPAPRSASVRRNLCLYCGNHAKQRGFCHAHSDLPAHDPLFASVLHNARSPQ